MLEYIKELGFFKLLMMAVGAIVVDFIFLAILWMIP